LGAKFTSTRPGAANRGRIEEAGSARADATTAAHLSASGRAPERVTAALVTANFFDVLGVDAQVGRLFRRDEDHPGSPPIVVLADRT
jgi:hypothetical protein